MELKSLQDTSNYLLKLTHCVLMFTIARKIKDFVCPIVKMEEKEVK